MVSATFNNSNTALRTEFFHYDDRIPHCPIKTCARFIFLSTHPLTLWGTITSLTPFVNPTDRCKLSIFTITIGFLMLEGLVVGASWNIKHLTHLLNGIILFLLMNCFQTLIDVEPILCKVKCQCYTKKGFMRSTTFVEMIG